ncbi:DUF6517 family protein [Halosimplex amylolyticum]|uniref:DUF6517 family protein n=1 Tax=Halosimplex amylolyticum TaxID=3396616 RepID=UPI003F5591D6
MRRLSLLAAVAVVVVVAGCSGAGPGDRTPQSIEADAARSTVDDAALSETGFAEASVGQVAVNRSGTLRISGDVQMTLRYRVNGSGWRAVYQSSGGQGVFALYTVPRAKPDNVAATIDPLGDRSLAAVVDGAQDTYSDTGELEHVRNRTATVLGSEATVRQYAGSATAGGEPADVTVYVATVDHDGDVVRAVAVVPTDGDDWSTVRPMFEGIER